MPYRLIMGKLGKPPPIPGLNAPNRIESIVHELFPHHPSRIKDHRSTKCRIEAEKYEITTSGQKKIGILTLDIQNTFNSAPREGIMKAMEQKKGLNVYKVNNR